MWSVPEYVCVNEWGGGGGGQMDPNYERRLLRAKQRGKQSERVSNLHLNIKQCLLLTNYHFLKGTFWAYRCTEIGFVLAIACTFESSVYSVALCVRMWLEVRVPFSGTRLPSKTMLLSACVNYSDGHRYTNNSNKSTGTTSQHLHKHTRAHIEKEKPHQIFTQQWGRQYSEPY